MRAAAIHYHAQKCGDLVVWTIFDHPADHPTQFVARPFIGVRPLLAHLAHKDLGTLRALLPAGLTRLERSPKDDPKIIETWI